jgi:hypothetical protein
MDSNKPSLVLAGIALALLSAEVALMSGLPVFWPMLAIAMAIACLCLAVILSTFMRYRPRWGKALAGVAVTGLVGLIMYKPLAAQYKKEQKEGHQIELSYVRQYETQVGYVLQLRTKSMSRGTIFVPSDSFQVTVVRDERQVESLSPEQRKGLLYGATAMAFDNKLVLDAAVEGRSYANASASIACVGEARNLFLLVTVAGPGSSNPSARLQLGPRLPEH